MTRYGDRVFRVRSMALKYLSLESSIWKQKIQSVFNLLIFDVTNQKLDKFKLKELRMTRTMLNKTKIYENKMVPRNK